MRMASLERIRLESFSICLMADLLGTIGIDLEPVLDRCGLTRAVLDSPDLTVTGPQELNFQREFVALTRGRHDVWEKLALRYRGPSISPWGFALTTAPSLRRFIELVVEFNDISYSLVRAENYAHDPMTNCIELKFDDIPDDLREFTMYRDTLGFTNLLHDDLWHGTFPLIRIETQLSREQVRGFDFRASVKYGAERTAWFWPSHLDERAPALADPALHDNYLRKARATLLDVDAGDPLIKQIKQTLAQTEEHISLPELAGRLNLSERALQRRLLRSGQTLRGLVNGHRQQTAERLLTQSPDPIGIIALKLGYSDQATFNHAFKRWTGMSPSAFRRHQYARPGGGA